MNSKNMMDERFMCNANEFGGALEALEGAKVVEYTTMAATESRRKYGIVAQSIKEKLPLAVNVDGMGNHYVDVEALVPVLVKAVQELTEIVNSFVTMVPAEGEMKAVLLEEPVIEAETAEPVDAPTPVEEPAKEAKKTRTRKPKAQTAED